MPDQLNALDVPHLDHTVKAPCGQEPWGEIAEAEDVLAVQALPLPTPKWSGIKDLHREGVEENESSYWHGERRRDSLPPSWHSKEPKFEKNILYSKW